MIRKEKLCTYERVRGVSVAKVAQHIFFYDLIAHRGPGLYESRAYWH